MEIKLTQIIITQNWQFPLNNNLFEKLITFKKLNLSARSINDDEVKNSVNDFETIFLITIKQMQKQGVEFFSPGGSYKRKFIYWFNAHFWIDIEFEKPLTISKSHFDNLYQQVALNYNCQINILSIKEDVTITGTCNLTSLGKEFIQLLLQSKCNYGMVNFED